MVAHTCIPCGTKILQEFKFVDRLVFFCILSRELICATVKTGVSCWAFISAINNIFVSFVTLHGIDRSETRGRDIKHIIKFPTSDNAILAF